MKRVSIIAMVMFGFIAGVAFVFSCGSGTDALAVTDVTGIETRLDTISSQINTIDDQITSLYNLIAGPSGSGAEIITIKALEFVNLDAGSIFSNPISLAGYKEIIFMAPSNTSIAYYAHHTASGLTQTIRMDAGLDDYGTMPAYGNTVVIEASTSGTEDGWLIVKLVP